MVAGCGLGLSCPFQFVPTLVQIKQEEMELRLTISKRSNTRQRVGLLLELQLQTKQQITGPRGQLLQHIPVAVCAEAEALTAICVQAWCRRLMMTLLVKLQ